MKKSTGIAAREIERAAEDLIGALQEARDLLNGIMDECDASPAPPPPPAARGPTKLFTDSVDPDHLESLQTFVELDGSANPGAYEPLDGSEPQNPGTLDLPDLAVALDEPIKKKGTS